VRSRSPRGATLQQEIPLPGCARRGARESVVRSRPAEPDASRYPASARIESSFACLEVMASRSSLSGRGASYAPTQRSSEKRVVDALLCRQAQRNGCGSLLFNHPGPKPRILGGLSRRSGSSFGTVLRTGRSSRLDAGARSSSSVPRAIASVLGERGRLSLRKEHAGSRVGSEPGMTGFVRITASEVSGHALPVPSTCEEQGSRSLARAEAIHAARTTRRRSRPSEERRCLPLCGRANVPRGGRKRRRHVLPPCTGKVVGSLG
jgi:hypothetical protein